MIYQENIVSGILAKFRKLKRKTFIVEEMFIEKNSEGIYKSIKIVAVGWKKLPDICIFLPTSVSLLFQTSKIPEHENKNFIPPGPFLNGIPLPACSEKTSTGRQS